MRPWLRPIPCGACRRLRLTLASSAAKVSGHPARRRQQFCGGAVRSLRLRQPQVAAVALAADLSAVVPERPAGPLLLRLRRQLCLRRSAAALRLRL